MTNRVGGHRLGRPGVISVECSLRRADEADFAFCESLSRRNIAGYRAMRDSTWNPARFRASWAEFENGTWAVRQAQGIAARRGFRLLRLRVYRENPARVMYARLGFSVDSVVDGTIHLSCLLTAGRAA